MLATLSLRDALVTGGRLAREALYLAAERLDGVGAVTPDWLTSALQVRFPGVRVGSLTPLAGDTGTTDRARLRVSYDDPGSGAQPPASVFVKMPPRDAKTRLFVNLMALGATEARFYREIAPAVPVAVPDAYHSTSGRAAQRFVLVLEDLAARNVRFTNISHRVSLDEARTVVLALARLHARFWDSPRFANDLAWLRHRDNNRNLPVERLICAAAVAPALRKFADLVPLELHDAAPFIISSRDRLEAAWAEPPLTLVHGDAHVGNMYFPARAGAGLGASGSSQADDARACDAGSVGFLDWQVVQRGQGMRDVAYFLVNSVPTEVRRAHERELIASYLAALAEQGIAAAPFDRAWRQYRLHAVYTWIAAVVTAAAATLQAEPIVRAGLARSSTALVDLDSLGALKELCG